MNAVASATAPASGFGQSKLTASVSTVTPEAVLRRSTTVVFVAAHGGGGDVAGGVSGRDDGERERGACALDVDTSDVYIERVIKIVQAAAFKQTCLALMDEVDAKGTSIIITKRGKAIARLVPVATTRPQALGCLAGKIELVDEDFSLPAWTVRATKGKP